MQKSSVMIKLSELFWHVDDEQVIGMCILYVVNGKGLKHIVCLKFSDGITMVCVHVYEMYNFELSRFNGKILLKILPIVIAYKAL